MNPRDEAQHLVFQQMLEADPLDEVTHRVFADWLEEHGLDDEAAIQRAWTEARYKEARAFFQELADHYDMRFADLIDGAHKYQDSGEYIVLWGDTEYAVPEEFWDHFVILTGRPVPDDKRDTSILSCTC